MKKFFKNLVRFFLATFIVLIIAVFLAPVNKKIDIHGNSMHPTYNTGDSVRYQTLKEINDVPKNGDVLIFNVDTKKLHPTFKLTDECSLLLDVKNKCYKREKVMYIKRIIAMENDYVEVKNNKVYINRKLEKLSDFFEFSAFNSPSENTKQENLKKDYKYASTNKYTISDVKGMYRKIPNKNYGKISKGYYFVMGDNRDSSSDSRHFGLIKEEDIVGIAKN